MPKQKKERSHDRSPEKVGFSVALPRVLCGEIEKIAAKETRTRNGQIEHFLAEAVARWHQERQGTPAASPLPDQDATRLRTVVAETVALLGQRGQLAPLPPTAPAPTRPGRH